MGGVSVQKPGDVIANAYVSGASQYTLPTLTEPDCTGLPSRSDSGSTFSPGYYPGGMHLSGNGTWTFQPGLYCLDGDLSINNGAMIGDGIMIYMKSGNLHINGGTNVLKAAQNGEVVDASGVVWNGMLFFQAYGNTGEFIMNGNAGSTYVGTIFVPDAHCRINGSGEGTGTDAQYVCDTIEFKGTSDTYMTYTQTNKYVPPPPTTISLVE